MLYVLVRELQWAGMSVEGQEKAGGVGEPSSLAAQWSRDVPGPALFCRGISQCFCAERSSLQRWKIAVRSRVDGGVKVPIGHGQTWHCFVAGHCGKVSASWGESRDMWAQEFLIYAMFHLVWQASQFSATNNFQVLLENVI